MKKHLYKGKYYLIIIAFIVILIIFLDVFLFNYKQNILKEEQLSSDEDKTNITDNSKNNLDKYYNATIPICPEYTLKQSLDLLNSYDNISVTIKQTKKDGINEAHINIVSSNEDMSGTLKLDNGKIEITDATATSLEDTKYASEMNAYASYFIYGLLCS